MQGFPKESLPAFLNFLQAKYDAFTGAVAVSSSPYYAMIDPCDICQLRCPTCPTGIENEGRKSKIESNTHYRSDRTRLTPALFDALIEETGEHLFKIDFHSWGEPLLNPHTPDFIRKAKTYGIETSIHTNLSLKLTDEQLEELLTSGLDQMIVSVDGFTQEVYERFRVGGDVALVKENLKRAASIRDRLGLSTWITYKFLVFSWNEHEVADAQAFAQEHGLVFGLTDACVPDAEWLPSHRQEEKPFLTLLDVEELDRQWAQAGQPGYWREHEKHPFFLPVELGQNWLPTDGPLTDSYCDWHYSTAVVQPRGQLAPCCMVEKEGDRFGTVVPGEVALADVWNGESYRKSRAVFAGENPAELEDVDTICTRCYFPDALKHNYANYDERVIERYLELYGHAEPVLAKAFSLLQEGEGEISRAMYVAFFEQGVAGRLAAVRAGELELVPRQSGESAGTPLAAEQLGVQEAAAIMQVYIAALGRFGIDGNTVHDVSLLPYPKSRITGAMLTLVKATSDQEEKTSFTNSAMVLAFFQPDVGSSSAGLDEMSPKAQTWQDLVQSEMRTLGRAFAEAS